MQEAISVTDLYMMETFPLPVLFQSLPDAKECVQEISLDTSKVPNIHLLLFKNVVNTKGLLEMVRSTGAENPLPQCLMVDASKIMDISLLQLATTRAIMLTQQGLNKTRSLYTEIIYNLGMGTNISECIKLFGMNTKTLSSHVLVLIVDDKTNSEEWLLSQKNALMSLVQGECIGLSELSALRDMDGIAKIYGMNNMTVQDVMSSMAIKGYL